MSEDIRNKYNVGKTPVAKQQEPTVVGYYVVKEGDKEVARYPVYDRKTMTLDDLKNLLSNLRGQQEADPQHFDPYAHIYVANGKFHGPLEPGKKDPLAGISQATMTVGDQSGNNVDLAEYGITNKQYSTATYSFSFEPAPEREMAERETEEQEPEI